MILIHSEYCTLAEAQKLAAKIMRCSEWVDGCLVWRKSCGQQGHARMWWKGKRYQVTHLVWLITRGEPVPEGLVVRHKCDNRPCICDQHIEIGTQKENVADAISRGRFKGIDNIRPHQYKSKLSSLEENPYNF